MYYFYNVKQNTIYFVNKVYTKNPMNGTILALCYLTLNILIVENEYNKYNAH